jgi:predicted ATP-grasp superfamily ATP-dependent carboligase
MATTLKALVTDGDQRPALAIVRSLGRRGTTVLAGEERPASLASASRHCAGRVTYPSPYRAPRAFEAFLLDFVKRERVDVVIPVTDVTTYLVSRIQVSLKCHCAVAAPPFEAFEAVSNKQKLLERASACGIPTPRSHVVDGLAALQSLVDRIDYPAVVKPARSRIRTGAGWIGTSVHYASSKADLRRLYEEREYLASYPSLIQQRIVGPGLGVFVLFSHGRLLTAFAHRRLREKPPSGGVSVLCESVPVDPDLRAQAVRLLKPLGWHGVAMLEYKQDARTGRAFLMEVNGRFWGSLQLAVDAGVDFPYLSFQLAAGGPLKLPDTYTVGIKSRWLLGDLDQLLIRLFERRADLPDGAPSVPRSLVEFAQLVRPRVRYDVMRPDDPMPAFRELHHYARNTARAGWRTVGDLARYMRDAFGHRPAPIADAVHAADRNAGALR